MNHPTRDALQPTIDVMSRLALISLIWVGASGCGSSPSGDDDDSDSGMPAMPLSADEAASACAIFGSCMGDGINDCYTDAMPHWSTTEARCVLAAAGNCTAVRACFGMTAAIDSSCSSTRFVTCDGNNLVTCGDGVRSTVSCPDASLLLGVGAGATCIMTSALDALCGDAACTVDSASCDGSVAKACIASEGVAVSIDCARYGQTCTSGGCTAAGGGGACASGTLPSCSGTAITRCRGGVELRSDCAALVSGGSCFPGITNNPDPYCGVANTCYPVKGTETCSGNAVTFCAAGTPATIECTTLGFTRCFGGKCTSL